MLQGENNPDDNRLSIDEAELLKAIESSGYPLQSVAIDRINQALAEIWLHDFGSGRMGLH